MNKNEKEKTYGINLTNFEAVTLYQLMKNEYCDFVTLKKNTAEYKALDKSYNLILDKLENAIANTQ